MSSELSPGSDPNSPSFKQKGVDGPAPKAQPEDTTLLEDGMPLNPGEQTVQFIPAGQDPANGDAKVEIGDSQGPPKFVGLGKEELMKFANDPFWVRLRWILFILFWLIWLAMLVGAVVIILYAPKCSDKLVGPTDGPYVQLSAEALSADNGKLEGINDASIKYLQDLGVNTVIISQILKSDDSGEVGRVIDFEAVDLKYGNYEQFKALVQRLKEKAIKVILQLIPNHSSIKHPWFEDSQKVETWYVTKDASTESSWASQLTPDVPGSAWSPLPSNPQKSYLHQFGNDTADLNFRNSDVVTEMNRVLQHWYAAGIEGFLLSDVSFLLENVKDLEKSTSQINQANADVIQKLLDSSSWNDSVKTENRTGPYAVVEVTKLSVDKSIPYYNQHMAVVSTSFDSLKENFTGNDLKKTIEDTLGKITKYPVHWKVNAPELSGQGQSSSPAEKALALFAAMIRGQLVLSGGKGSAGSSAPKDPSAFYKDLIHAAKELDQPGQGGGSTEFETDPENPGVLIMKRSNDNDFIVAGNFGPTTVSVNLENFKGEAKAKVLTVTPNLTTMKSHDELADSIKKVELVPNSGVILKLLKD